MGRFPGVQGPRTDEEPQGIETLEFGGHPLRVGSTEGRMGRVGVLSSFGQTTPGTEALVDRKDQGIFFGSSSINPGFCLEGSSRGRRLVGPVFVCNLCGQITEGTVS